MHRTLRQLFKLCLIFVFLFAGGNVGELAAQGVGGMGQAAYMSANLIQSAVQKAVPSVVGIIGNAKQEDPLIFSDRFNLSHGTGIIVKEDGWILTNAHVVKDLNNIVVVTSDGKRFNGVVTHLDETSDLALVRVNASGLPVAVFADDKEIQIGETAIAIGTPVSFSLRNSISVGIISGLNRSIHTDYRLIQTDASINPGNSGGPLINLQGEVLGVNSLKFAEVGVDNIGFAIPSDTVQYVTEHFFKYGKVNRPYSGLQLSESWSAVVGLPTNEPLTVTRVDKGSFAEKAGIQSGDELVAVDSVKVHSLIDMNEQMKTYLPGQSAVLLMRNKDGKIEEKTIVFAEDPKENNRSKPEGIDAFLKNRYEIWMKVGHPTAMVNFRQKNVEKPYLANGNAMAGLSVVAGALGIEPVYSPDGKTAALKAGSLSVEFTADIPKANVNGADVSLPAAPKRLNQEMMIPLRFLAEQLGADIAYYGPTSEIVISGFMNGEGGGLFADSAKTRIGDSHYRWSMAYPSDLVIFYQSPEGEYIRFYDAHLEFALTVRAEENVYGKPDPEWMLDELEYVVEGNLMDIRFVDGPFPYARAISKDHSYFYETRLYYNKDYLFYVTMTFFDKGAVAYASEESMWLLDSFRTDFDGGDTRLKDISVIQDGMRGIVHEDYGVKLSVPVEWYGDEQHLQFSSHDGAQFSVRITSVRDGDTLEAWVERQRQFFKSAYVEQSTGEAKPFEVSGLPALAVDYAYTFGKNWYEQTVVYLFRGSYKYMFALHFPREKSEEYGEWFGKIMESVRLDDLDAGFGNIPDEMDFFEETTVKQNHKHGYTVEVPKYWNDEEDYGDQSFFYSFPGGLFGIMVMTAMDKAETGQFLLENLEQETPGGIRKTQRRDTLAGLPADRRLFEWEDEEGEKEAIVYLVEKDGSTYALIVDMYKGVQTPENQKRIRDVLDSFRYTE